MEKVARQVIYFIFAFFGGVVGLLVFEVISSTSSVPWSAERQMIVYFYGDPPTWIIPLFVGVLIGNWTKTLKWVFFTGAIAQMVIWWAGVAPAPLSRFYRSFFSWW